MRRAVTFVILLSMILSAAAPAEAMTAAEKEKLLQELERTRDKFLKAVGGLSEAQWNFKPAPERWSIAQCAEHIAAAEPFLRNLIVGFMKEPASVDLVKQGAVKDETVSKFIVDRSQKFKAPEPLQPNDRFGSPAAAVESFKQERIETIILVGGDKDLRGYAQQHPAFGVLDAYGWLLFLSGHSERHTLQIEEVKADPNFPKE